MTDGSDPVFQQAHDGVDIIIPVMGPTGVGKSTFINSIAGWDATKVGRTMESKTKTLEPIIIDIGKTGSVLPFLEGKRLILLDTPGFDDTAGHEAVILRRIAIWLARSYKSDQQRLGGIIHLHDITQTRMIPSLKRSLDVFSCLCGDSAYTRVALGTTKWPAESQATGAGRTHSPLRYAAEVRLKELEKNYWAGMVKSGSKTHRIETLEPKFALGSEPALESEPATESGPTMNRDSALQVVRSILTKLEQTTGGGVKQLRLQLQKEIVDQGKAVHKTKAGKVLEMEGRLGKNRFGHAGFAGEGDEEKVIQKQLQELDRELAKLATNKNALSRLRSLFGSKKEK